MLHSEFQPYSKTIKRTERKKGMEIGQRYQKTFKKLKNKITSQPVLSLPKREGKF